MPIATVRYVGRSAVIRYALKLFKTVRRTFEHRSAMRQYLISTVRRAFTFATAQRSFLFHAERRHFLFYTKQRTFLFRSGTK